MAVVKLKNRSLSIFLLLVIALLGIAGCSSPKSSHDYLTLARKERQSGDDQAALIDLKNALKMDSKNGEARYLLAQILIQRGEGSAAEIELHKAIDLGVNKSYVAGVMGQALILQGNYNKVIDNIQVANGDKGKVAADIYNVRGDAYLALSKTDKAKSEFEKALKEYPDSVDAYLGLGHVAEVSNDLNLALQQTETALSKDINSSKSWLMKARLLRDLRKSDDARSAYNRVLQIDQKNITAHLGLASMALNAGRLDTAKAEVDAAVKIAPKALAVQYAVAVIDFKRGEYKNALETIQPVLKLAPDNLPSVLLHGAIAFAEGSFEQARDDLSRVLARNPNDSYARRLLANTQYNLGETGKAMETLQPLLKPEVADVNALVLAGELQLKTKNYVKATEYLNKAIEINPNSQQLQTTLAISHLGAGDVEQGMSELEEAAKHATGQSQADVLLIVTHFRRKEYDEALTAISNLEKKVGSNPVTYNLRGAALAGKQDFSNARKAFEQALAIQPTYYSATANLVQLDVHDGKPDAARKRLEAYIEKDKKNMQAMMALAGVALIQKNEQEYVRWLEKARETQPDAILPYIKLADYYSIKKDKARALEIASEPVKAYPNSPEALELLGSTQLSVGNNEDALKTFTKLVAAAPNAPAAYLQLARAQSAVNKLIPERASLNKALELKSDFIQAQEMLLRLDLTENKVVDALKIARQLQIQQPKSPVGYDHEGDILMMQKEYAQAVKLYEQALGRDAGSAGMIKLHRALVLSGDESSAEQRLKAWIKQNPKDVIVRNYAADYYMVSKRNRDAIVQYEELLKITPQDPQALNNLAILYQRIRDSRDLVTAEQALKFSPDTPGIQDTLGWILTEKGQLDRAIELLRKAVNAAPEAGSIRYHLAVALVRADRKAEAKKELEAAIGTGAKFPEFTDAKEMLKGL